MATPADVCVGAIVAIAIVLISYTAWRRWHGAKGAKFTYKTPAGPELRTASEKLTAVLEDIISTGQSLENTDPKTTDDSDMVVVGDLVPPEVQTSIQLITKPAARIVENLKTSTPTYASIHAVYKGLCDADKMYSRVADVYIAKGRTIKCDPLISIGKQVQLLVVAVHELGSALNLE